MQELINISKIKDNVDVILWINDFLKGKIKDFWIKKISYNSKIKIFNDILQNIGGGFFSTKEGTNQEEQKSPNSSWVCYILEKTNIDLKSFLTLTWKEAEFLLEGIEWNMNEQTKDGQNENKIKMAQKNAHKKLSIEDAKIQARKVKERIKKGVSYKQA